MSADLLPGEMLGEMGERRIYREVLEPRYRTARSFGDDCAPLGRDLVVTTDSCPAPLVAQLGEEDPFYTGWLLATINLSDLAAAGAAPMGLVVNYTLPASTKATVLDRIMEGVDRCAARHGASVLGGDIRDGQVMHLSATAIGRATRCRTRGWASHRLSRRGARSGDVLLLVGDPGYLWGAALVNRIETTLTAEDKAAVLERARRPIAQVEAGRLLANRGLARAAMDVSDGLYASVRLLAETNGLGAVMDPKIDLDPLLQRVCDQSGVSSFQLGQTWGDWCLLVAVRRPQADQTEKLLRQRGIGVRQVGVLVADHAEIRVEGHDEPWQGVDQERFSTRSWHGDGIDEQIARMRRLSAAHL